MAENLRKAVEQELTTLHGNVTQMGSAIAIVKQAEKVATETTELFETLLKSSKDLQDKSAKELTTIIAKQSDLLIKFTALSVQLATMSAKLEGTDIPKRLDALTELQRNQAAAIKTIQESINTSARLQVELRSDLNSLDTKVASHKELIIGQMKQTNADSLAAIATESNKNRLLISDSRKTIEEQVKKSFSTLNKNQEDLTTSVQLLQRRLNQWASAAIALIVISVLASYLMPLLK